MKNTTLKSASGSSFVTIIVIAAVLLIGGYLGYTYISKSGIFANKTASTETQKKSPDPIVIKNIEQKDDTLSVNLTKNSKEDGYCILTLQSQRSLLTIDDSKDKDSKVKQCTGWVIGAKDLLKGDYTAMVKFVAPSKDYSTSKTFELK